MGSRSKEKRLEALEKADLCHQFDNTIYRIERDLTAPSTASLVTSNLRRPS
jgi:hypothetical protein